MQNTRLSNLFGFIDRYLRNWFANPWRKTSVWLICLLLGNFLGSAVTVISGQAAVSDIVVAVTALLLTELVSWLTYNQRPMFSSWGIDLINALKIGFVYSMFVEAFKLGS